MNDQVNNDITTLQIQLSFQEDSLQSLNDVVIRQQQELDRLRDTVRLLKKNIEELRGVSGESSSNERPPHY